MSTFEELLRKREREIQLDPKQRVEWEYKRERQAREKAAKASTFENPPESPEELPPPGQREHARPAPEPAADRRVIMKPLSEFQERPVEWLWKRYLPKAYLTLWSGDPGLGKSHIWEDIAARLTTSGVMPDGTIVDPGALIVLTCEEGAEDILKPRIRIAGGDCTRVGFITGSINPNRPTVEILANLKDDLAGIERNLPQWEKILGAPIRLLVVDPFMNHLGGINPNKEGEVRPLMAEIAAFLQRTRLAMLGIRHLNKDETKSLLYRGGGSMAFTGTARSEFIVGRDPEIPDQIVFARIKGNLSREPDPLAYHIIVKAIEGENEITGIEWLGKTSKSAEDVISSGREKGGTAGKRAEQILLGLLGEGQEVSAEDCYAEGKAQGDVGEKTMRLAAKKLNVTFRQKGFHGGWVWSLTEDTP